MTIECVDGQMATPHITGAQKGAMHAGVVGDGCYVLATGNKCKATQNSATSVTIGTGDLFIHGRHHQITAAETVTIQSGTQGQKRNDLICAVYHRDAQGIEQPTVTVLKGTPTTGTPADPTVPAGNVLNGDAVDYFPLYRVSLNGTTASAPVQLFKVLPTLASLGDSVSQTQSFSSGGVSAARVGRVCTVSATLSAASVAIPAWSSGVVATLPEGMRPPAAIGGSAFVETSGNSIVPLAIEHSGSVRVLTRAETITKTTLMSFSVTYAV